MKKTDKKITNKRKQKRFPKQCATQCISKNVTFKGISSDFSISGLFLQTNHPLKNNEVVDIIIHLPDGSLSKIKGRVTRSSKEPRNTDREKNIIRKKIRKLEQEMDKQDLAGKARERIEIEINALKRALVIQNSLDMREQNTREGMGIEILEKDASYLHLIRGCLHYT
jgi:hypothetical protein